MVGKNWPRDWHKEKEREGYWKRKVKRRSVKQESRDSGGGRGSKDHRVALVCTHAYMFMHANKLGDIITIPPTPTLFHTHRALTSTTTASIPYEGLLFCSSYGLGVTEESANKCSLNSAEKAHLNRLNEKDKFQRICTWTPWKFTGMYKTWVQKERKKERKMNIRVALRSDQLIIYLIWFTQGAWCAMKTITSVKL